MHLSELAIFDLRNLTEVHMECGPGLNIISGKNAAGKTAVLEAIHILARASSFRTPRINDVIQHGKQRLTVTANILNKDDKPISTGLEKSRQATKIRFNGCNVSKRSDQARNIPVMTATPESQNLLTGTPKERRHWLDWSMFHVEPGYMENWQSYHHALRHRNALLRQQHKNSQFDIWEEILAKTAVILRQDRLNYIENINIRINKITNGCVGKISLGLKTEAQEPNDFKNFLKEQREADILLGYTQHGPHREDVLFDVSGREAGKILSRGEGKLLILFLILAQAQEYMCTSRLSPIMLIDDLSAELDEGSRHHILEQLKSHNLQAFITTTDPDALKTAFGTTCKRFHVEHGNIVN